MSHARASVIVRGRPAHQWELRRAVGEERAAQRRWMMQLVQGCGSVAATVEKITRSVALPSPSPSTQIAEMEQQEKGLKVNESGRSEEQPGP